MTAKLQRPSKPHEVLCAYCGMARATTKDHVPPKGLFPSPRPALNTVPSCDNCNCGDAEDDDYFRFVLTAVADTDGQPAVAAIRETVARALRRPEADRFRAALHASIQFPSNYDAFGTHAGPNPMGEVDLKRMKRVANRILKAYFYIHTGGRRIPQSFEVITFVHDELFFFSPNLPRFFHDTLNESREYMIGDGSVFRYRFSFPKSKYADTSVWWFLYYNAFVIQHIVRHPPADASPTDSTALAEGQLLIVSTKEAASPRVRRRKRS